MLCELKIRTLSMMFAGLSTVLMERSMRALWSTRMWETSPSLCASTATTMKRRSKTICCDTFAMLWRGANMNKIKIILGYNKLLNLR